MASWNNDEAVAAPPARPISAYSSTQVHGSEEVPEYDWNAQIHAARTDSGHTLGSVNVTNLWSNFDTLAALDCDVYAIQEVSIPAAQHGQAKGRAARLGFSLELTDTDPEQAQAHAGVGVMVRRPGVLRQLRVNTPEGRDAQAAGRLIRAAVQPAGGIPLILLSLYGWAGADHDNDCVERTDALVSAARLEVAIANDTPTFVVGDLNASIHRLPALQEALDMQDWIDIGNLHHLELQMPHQPGLEGGTGPWPRTNCWAHGPRRPHDGR